MGPQEPSPSQACVGGDGGDSLEHLLAEQSRKEVEWSGSRPRSDGGERSPV